MSRPVFIEQPDAPGHLFVVRWWSHEVKQHQPDHPFAYACGWFEYESDALDGLCPPDVSSLELCRVDVSEAGRGWRSYTKGWS